MPSVTARTCGKYQEFRIASKLAGLRHRLRQKAGRMTALKERRESELHAAEREGSDRLSRRLGFSFPDPHLPGRRTRVLKPTERAQRY
jgi:hypothetical protein